MEILSTQELHLPVQFNILVKKGIINWLVSERTLKIMYHGAWTIIFGLTLAFAQFDAKSRQTVAFVLEVPFLLHDAQIS